MTEISQRVDNQPQRLAHLDGLRGLAALLVVVWHYYGAYQVSHPETLSFLGEGLSRLIIRCLSLTWCGVEIFFVLSGYLLSRLLMQNIKSPRYYYVFYMRRVLRIFPLYFLILSWFCLFIYFAYPSSNSSIQWLLDNSMPLWSYFLFVQNIFMSQTNTAGANFLGMSWSVAVEEQFYLFLPLAIRMISFRQIGKVVLLCTLVALFTRWNSNEFARVAMLFSRLDSLSLGVLCAWLEFRYAASKKLELHSRRLYLGSAVLLATFVFAPLFSGPALQPWLFMGQFTTISLCCVLLILALNSSRDNLVKKFFCNRLLMGIGLNSYAIYLYHQVFQGLAYSVFSSNAPYTHFELLPCLLALVSLLLWARFTWHFIERPLISYGQTVNY